uniref:Uncharacterized protein n=1 Tax=Chlorocebus sabaeus TaxID=60711 RepID=A0A0D9QV04_CHLSB
GGGGVPLTHFSPPVCSTFLYLCLPEPQVKHQRMPESEQGAGVASVDHPPACTALGGPRNAPLLEGAFTSLQPSEDTSEWGAEPADRGNKNDDTLYTPDDLPIPGHFVPTVCPAETLGCFRLELSVIGFEEGPSVGTAVLQLQYLLDPLGSQL